MRIYSKSVFQHRKYNTSFCAFRFRIFVATILMLWSMKEEKREKKKKKNEIYYWSSRALFTWRMNRLPIIKYYYCSLYKKGKKIIFKNFSGQRNFKKKKLNEIYTNWRRAKKPTLTDYIRHLFEIIILLFSPLISVMRWYFFIILTGRESYNHKLWRIIFHLYFFFFSFWRNLFDKTTVTTTRDNDILYLVLRLAKAKQLNTKAAKGKIHSTEIHLSFVYARVYKSAVIKKIFCFSQFPCSLQSLERKMMYSIRWTIIYTQTHIHTVIRPIFFFCLFHNLPLWYTFIYICRSNLCKLYFSLGTLAFSV